MSQKRRAYEDTSVPVAETREKIRALLLRYGAQQFGIAESATRADVGFRVKSRTYRLTVPLPAARSDPWASAARAKALEREREQEERRMWRVVFHWLKGQLEAVESGLLTFESVFLAHALLPSGETTYEHLDPQFDYLQRQGRLPSLLPDPEERRVPMPLPERFEP